MAILGAAGGIGQPLSLLLKQDSLNSKISHLALYDIANMGMSADLDHIPTSAKVTGHSGEASLPEALDKADIVIIPAGVPRKPGMTRDDLFNINAGIVKSLVAACGKWCPHAHLLIISNPVNSTVPIAYETLRAAGVSEPSIFGVTTLDIIRAKAFVGRLKEVDDPFSRVHVDVVGGHSGPTIVPLLSRVKIGETETLKGVNFTSEEKQTLIQRIQYGGDEVVKAKDGGGSATLSMAFAGKIFYDQFIRSLESPSRGIIAFVKIPVSDGRIKTETFGTAGYIATEINLDKKGKIFEMKPIKTEDEGEQALINVALKELAINVAKGEQFVAVK